MSDDTADIVVPGVIGLLLVGLLVFCSLAVYHTFAHDQPCYHHVTLDRISAPRYRDVIVFTIVGNPQTFSAGNDDAVLLARPGDKVSFCEQWGGGEVEDFTLG